MSKVNVKYVNSINKMTSFQNSIFEPSKHWFSIVIVGLLLLPGFSWAEKPNWAGKNIPAALAACEEQLENCLSTCIDDSMDEICIVFPGDGYVGAELSYQDNGDGTFTDMNTGLVWEIKTADGSIHEDDNTFTWTDSSDGDYTNPDGTAFDFIDELNTTAFAGYTDWRLPTAKELISLMDYSTHGPSVHPSFPGEVTTYYYWSSTDEVDPVYYAWCADFRSGGTGELYKTTSMRVRAVRGGW